MPSGEGTPRRSGAVSRVYEYDRAFAPVRIDDGLWGEARFDYDDNGQLVSAEGPRGSEQFSYDEARNIAGASSSPPFSGTASGYGPSFDSAFGKVTPAGKPSGWQRTPGGIVQIARGPKGEKIQLKHDECGRLIERRIERNGFRPECWRYRWDAHDRLVAVTQLGGEEWLFRYDPFGRRISKVLRFPEKERARAAQRYPKLVGDDGAPTVAHVAANTNEAPDGDVHLPKVGTAYLWDGAHMIAEAPLRLDGHIAWNEAVTWHFEGGESDDETASHRLLAKELSAGAMLPDGSVLEKAALFPIVCDHLGTPKEIFDAKGNLVWAADHHVWGEIRATRTWGNLVAMPMHDTRADVFTCPWRFPGQYEDEETGLFYNRHRHYDPLTGQYASPDPIGLAGGDRPQGYTPNPSVWVDPLGLAALMSRAGLFRGDTRSPSQIFGEGFKPWGDSRDIFAHARDATNPPSYYISTSRNITVSARPEFGAKYVYVIDKRVTGIDVNKTHSDAGKVNVFSHENEIAVPGGIPASSIIGVKEALPGGQFGPLINNPNYVR